MRQRGQNIYYFGSGNTTGNKSWLADIGVLNNPGMRYATGAINAMQFSNDGVNWQYMYGMAAPLTPGQVVFAGATGILSGSNNLFWDNANARLGIGTNVPAQPFTVGNKFSILQDGRFSQAITDATGVYGNVTYNSTLYTFTGTNNVMLNVSTPFGVAGTDSTVINSIFDPNIVTNRFNKHILIGRATDGILLGTTASYYFRGSNNAGIYIEKATNVALLGVNTELRTNASGSGSTFSKVSAFGFNITQPDLTLYNISNVHVFGNDIQLGAASYTNTALSNSFVWGVNGFDMILKGGATKALLLGGIKYSDAGIDTIATNYILRKSGTPPTSTPADSSASYIKDYLGQAGQTSPYDRTEDGKVLSMRDAAHREACFYKATGGANYSDKYYQGLISIENESISDSIATYQWSTALDNGAFLFTAHASLVAMQTWLNSNVSGNKYTGTKWILRATSTAKAGRAADPASMTLFFVREQ